MSSGLRISFSSLAAFPRGALENAGEEVERGDDVVVVVVVEALSKRMRGEDRMATPVPTERPRQLPARICCRWRVRRAVAWKMRADMFPLLKFIFIFLYKIFLGRTGFPSFWRLMV